MTRIKRDGEKQVEEGTGFGSPMRRMVFAERRAGGADHQQGGEQDEEAMTGSNGPLRRLIIGGVPPPPPPGDVIAAPPIRRRARPWQMRRTQAGSGVSPAWALVGSRRWRRWSRPIRLRGGERRFSPHRRHRAKLIAPRRRKQSRPRTSQAAINPEWVGPEDGLAMIGVSDPKIRNNHSKAVQGRGCGDDQRHRNACALLVMTLPRGKIASGDQEQISRAW